MKHNGRTQGGPETHQSQKAKPAEESLTPMEVEDGEPKGGEREREREREKKLDGEAAV